MAVTLSGREVSEEIKNRLKEKIAKENVSPLLTIVQVGNREDSNVYIRMKIKYAEECGVKTDYTRLDRKIKEDELCKVIKQLNESDLVHGIIVQLPFDCENDINTDLITNLIDPKKDVDGLSNLNAGKLLHGQTKGDCFLPCTPNGCMELIRKSGIKIEGSRAVVIGRSKIVGSPMAQLLIWANATVTVLHSRSKNIPEIVKEADILVVAIGKAGFVKKEWVKKGAVVIDCGINAIKDETKKSGQRLVGDVEPDVKTVAGYMTPVPGGVGPMTVAMLISNTVDSAIEKKKN
ncbi:hypothetical protein RND71_043574 [Anisodus tanguticus]|uniref:Methenyltetrahydrofolate cyclohydrolase n=1 Tax=Anisodus tanguticus TaxID=243964 RepID=A0AAE1QNR9_9SOLA|nr:hypothetical protein RND71_043574 [Anisodus tanguticus]